MSVAALAAGSFSSRVRANDAAWLSDRPSDCCTALATAIVSAVLGESTQTRPFCPTTTSKDSPPAAAHTHTHRTAQYRALKSSACVGCQCLHSPGRIATLPGQMDTSNNPGQMYPSAREII